MKKQPPRYKIREMTMADNEAVAVLVRSNLKKHGLDIPGTVYFDSCVDALYESYLGAKGKYFVMTDEEGTVVGGIGFDEFPFFPSCAELQKLYLADSVKGYGLGYRLIEFIEQAMRKCGYKASYLETHENLQAAIHIYEKCGYVKIERPVQVSHGAMTHFYYKELSKI